MSKKPTIRIIYPEASSVAMKLTEAMIRRTPGKRTVETVAEDKDSGDEGYLIADLDAVKTSTSVELVLTLCPSAMDYALTQLIAKNLTEEERKDIYCNASGVELLTALPSLAIADEVPVEQIKLADPQITQKMAAALYAAGCSKKSKLLDPFVRGLLADIEFKDNEDEYYISLSALIAIKKKMEEWKINDPFALYDQFQGSIPSWDDVEKAAQTIGQKSEPAGESDQDSDIEPGLLNDIEDNKEGGEE